MKNRINLLSPSTEIMTKTTSEGPGKLFIALGLICIIGTVGIYAYSFGMNRLTQNKIARVQDEITALNAVSEEMKTKGVVISEYTRTVTNLDNLKGTRPKLSVYLAELLEIIPAATNLRNLDIRNSPFEVTVRGESGSPLHVAQFGKNLQESEFFRDSLINTARKQIEENLFEYTITIAPGQKGGDKQ